MKKMSNNTEDGVRKTDNRDTMEFRHEVVIPNEDLPFKMFIFEGKDGNYKVSTHWHQSVEIFLVTEGTIDFYIDSHYFSLKEHQFVIVNSNQVHSIDCPYSNNTIVLQIPVETFQLYHRETPYISFIPQSQEKNRELLAMGGEVSRLEQKKMAAALDEKQLLDKLWETYELSHEAAKRQRVEIESVPKASRRIAELKKGISALGSVNVGAIQEFQRVNERYTYLTDQRDDVEKAKRELEEVIGQITGEMNTIFSREFQSINESFGQTFQELFGGGRATLELEDPDDILNCGIEIKVQPPGKALKTITLLSGGEKAFVAIALYFSILKVRPTPFVVMDEIEAALDDNNVVRFARYMRGMSEKTQFIVITHRRGTMEEADVLYGVTMQEQGVSRMLTIDLNDVEKELKLR